KAVRTVREALSSFRIAIQQSPKSGYGSPRGRRPSLRGMSAMSTPDPFAGFPDASLALPAGLRRVLGWLRQMRLALARRELLHADPDSSVTEVALSAGFTQLGRFSVQYRKAFGESPSFTIRRSQRRTEPE